MFPSDTSRDDVRINGRRPGPKSAYRLPTVQDRAKLAAAYTRAVTRHDYRGVLVALAEFLGFVCTRCGAPTEGRPVTVQLCPSCEHESAKLRGRQEKRR